PVADRPGRPRTPPGVGTPLRAAGVPGRRHPLGLVPDVAPVEEGRAMVGRERSGRPAANCSAR
ncbi:MAG: hypothetical protein ACREJK_07190, partial [Candidatus Methylomirabilales bacterium]